MTNQNKISINEFKAVFVTGNTGSGKTSLVFKLLESAEGKPVYFVRHPRPELLEPFGYQNLYSLGEMERLSNCIVYWDEPNTYLSVVEYKKNAIIKNVLSLARQRNITLIISTSDTRAFTKGTEAYFDCWIVKDMRYSMSKQRSQVRQVIQDNSFVCPDDFSLMVNEFLFDNRKHKNLNGRHVFDLPTGWSEELSTPYGLENNDKVSTAAVLTLTPVSLPADSAYGVIQKVDKEEALSKSNTQEDLWQERKHLE